MDFSRSHPSRTAAIWRNNESICHLCTGSQQFRIAGISFCCKTTRSHHMLLRSIKTPLSDLVVKHYCISHILLTPYLRIGICFICYRRICEDSGSGPSTGTELLLWLTIHTLPEHCRQVIWTVSNFPGTLTSCYCVSL